MQIDACTGNSRLNLIEILGFMWQVYIYNIKEFHEVSILMEIMVLFLETLYELS